MPATWGDLNRVPSQPAQRRGLFQRMVQPTPQVAPQPRTTPVSQPTTPVRDDNYYKHDLWEEIQRETRKPKWSAMGTLNEVGGPGTGRASPVDEETTNRLGLTTQWMDEAESGPMGEGATIEKYAAGNYLTPESQAKYFADMERNNALRPNSKHFGADWRPVTADDKYKVLDPRYVIWDDELGWITHKKNYNPDGGKSWWQRNAATALPAIMGTLLGGPAGTAIGLGMAGVRAASGQTSWRSLLPALLTAGYGLSGLPGMLNNTLGQFGGRLASGLIRQGGSRAISNLTGNRGGRG